MTRGDRLVVAFVALLAVLAWPATFLAASGPADVVVITGPRGTTEVPLSSERTLDIDGIHGSVLVRVEGGRVRVVESSCPDRICVRQGAVADAGGAIVCAPNGVTVTVGGGGGGLDAVVR